MLTQLFSRMGKRKKEHGKDKGGSSSETEEEGVGGGGGENKEGPSLAKKPRTDSEIKATTPTLEEEMQDQREKMQLLVSAFSNSQQDQYEIYRRSTFPKSAIRKLMQGICGASVPQNAVIAMAGITKVYVGEIIEEACQARETAQEEGPLQPKHIREAVRKLKNADKIPNSRHKRVFPFR